MRILMLCPMPYDLQETKGGVVSAVLNLLNGFRSFHTLLEVRLLSFSNQTPKIVNLGSNVEIEYVRVKSSVALLDYFASWRAMKAKISEYKPDIIHIQGSSPHLLRFLFLRKKNVVVTQHGVVLHEFKTLKKLPDKCRFLFKSAVEKYLYPMFDSFIFISNYNRDCFPASLTGKRYAVIPNAINEFDFNLNGVRRDHTIIYVGIISPRKNLLFLLHSMKSLMEEGRGYKLTVVGGYSDTGYKRIVEAAVRDSGLNESVYFVGWQPRDVVRSLMREQTLFILPSRQETLPLSIAEAMAAGVVPIAASVGGIPQMITHGVTGFLFERDNELQLTQILRDVYIGKYQLTQMSQGAHQFAMDNYHPKIVAGTTLDFYAQILKDAHNQ